MLNQRLRRLECLRYKELLSASSQTGNRQVTERAKTGRFGAHAAAPRISKKGGKGWGPGTFGYLALVERDSLHLGPALNNNMRLKIFMQISWGHLWA